MAQQEPSTNGASGVNGNGKHHPVSVDPPVSLAKEAFRTLTSGEPLVVYRGPTGSLDPTELNARPINDLFREYDVGGRKLLRSDAVKD